VDRRASAIGRTQGGRLMIDDPSDQVSSIDDANADGDDGSAGDASDGDSSDQDDSGGMCYPGDGEPDSGGQGSATVEAGGEYSTEISADEVADALAQDPESAGVA
jgi:hypothetical protein